MLTYWTTDRRKNGNTSDHCRHIIGKKKRIRGPDAANKLPQGLLPSGGSDDIVAP